MTLTTKTYDDEKWKLVPIEPTIEMLHQITPASADYEEWKVNYKAMLSAAPEPPSVSVDEPDELLQAAIRTHSCMSQKEVDDLLHPQPKTEQEPVISLLVDKDGYIDGSGWKLYGGMKPGWNDLYLAPPPASDEDRRDALHALNATIRRSYEELRAIIDNGSESMTHKDAVNELRRLTVEDDVRERLLELAWEALDRLHAVAHRANASLNDTSRDDPRYARRSRNLQESSDEWVQALLLYWPRLRNEIMDEIHRLRAENGELRKDASRYRWVKENLVVEYDDSYGIVWNISCAPSLETFDDVIDAMRGEKEE